MGKKRLPEERWRDHVKERLTALSLSGEVESLRATGLAILGRTKRYTPKEWAMTFHTRASSKEYREWQSECEAVGRRFGLAAWTIYLLCLVSGYDPEKVDFPIEVDWPNIKVVTDIDDPQFCARLAYEVQKKGLHLIQKTGLGDIPLVMIPPVDPPPLPKEMPPASSAFRLRVETPVGYPPEAAGHLEQLKSQLERELLSALGYSIKKRLRTSTSVTKAKALKVGKEKLPKRGLYEIVSENYRSGSKEKDKQRVKLIKVQRHRLKKRLSQPY